MYCWVVVPSEPVTVNDTVLLPVTNPVVPVILLTVALESVGVATNVTEVVPKGRFIVPPFVNVVPLMVNTDKLVFITMTVALYC